MNRKQRDMSAEYNTALDAQHLADYQKWLGTQSLGPNPVYDYDMQGAWLAGVDRAGNGHFPDTYKKPNHPTFSDESRYSGQEGLVGGQWLQDDTGRWVFVASPTNLEFRSPEELQRYFREVEPDSTLRLPSGGGGLADFFRAISQGAR